MGRIIPVIWIVSVFLFAAGCVFEGSVGPEGPEGPPGTPGNANVFSLRFDFSMEDATINGNVASVQYEVPDITEAVVDEGAVLLFFREQGTWTAMPFTFGIDSEELKAVDYLITVGYGFDDAFLEVFYEASTEEIDLSTQPDREMKAVIIEGFVAAKAGIDLRDYEAVKAYFGLKD